jgi:hypothetical protein
LGATAWVVANGAEKRTVKVASPATVLRLRGETEITRSGAGGGWVAVLGGWVAVLGGDWDAVEVPGDDAATPGAAPATAAAMARTR